MSIRKTNFIRYPGGKRRILKYIEPYLLPGDKISGDYIEPFLGGGSVFFHVNPKRAILSDINKDLIDLYRGIRYCPRKVWGIFKNFPETKEGYYYVRSSISTDDIGYNAARTLFLNRTCFKGMWRENAQGEFNVGYGGQDRRWVIREDILVEVSKRLKKKKLQCTDFEEVIEGSKRSDYLFVDPPYKPGEKELTNSHYSYDRFTFSDLERLSDILINISNKGVYWTLTVSSHSDIIELFKDFTIVPIPKGTGRRPGIIEEEPGEVIIVNHKGKS